MPRRDVQTNCARCVGSKKASTATRRFSVDGDQYEIALCDDHQRAFDRELSAWTRLATEIEQRVYRPMAATVERDLDRAAQRMAASSLAPPPPDPSKVVVHRLPPKMKLWQLSEHAKLRCQQRFVSERDALICAADPAVTFQTPKYAGTPVRLHKRGGVIVAADATTHTVVTVMTQAYFDTLELEPELERRERESVSG